MWSDVNIRDKVMDKTFLISSKGVTLGNSTYVQACHASFMRGTNLIANVEVFCRKGLWPTS